MANESLGFAKDLWKEGNALFEAGRLSEAKRKFKEALKVDPNYEDARFNLALTFLASGDPESAMKNLLRVMRKQNNKNDVKELYLKISEAIYEKYFRNFAARYRDIDEIEIDMTAEMRKKEQIKKIVADRLEEKPNEEKSNPKEEIPDEVVEGQIRRIAPVKTSFKLSDFVGYGDLVSACMDEIGLPVKFPSYYKEHNLVGNTGIMLYGPPGVGKTRFVKALAGELGLKLFILRISQVIDMYTGNSEKNIHKVFETARQNAPSILFLDEFDAFGTDRSDFIEGGGRRAINQLLIELDGMESNNENVFVIASTNRPFDIDPALKRSGRFQTEIYVRPPNLEDRQSLLRYYLGRYNILDDVKNVEILAKETEGYSGADIERVCKIATRAKILAEIEGKTLQVTDEYILSHLINDKTGGRSIRLWYQGLSELLGKKWFDYEYPDLYIDMKHYTEDKLGRL